MFILNFIFTLAIALIRNQFYLPKRYTITTINCLYFYYIIPIS